MKTLYYLVLVIAVAAIITISGCKSTQVVTNKIGAQLWAENCVRCHYTPSPTDYSNHQWDLIITHMQIRAQLTQVEKEKIVEFLNSAN